MATAPRERAEPGQFRARTRPWERSARSRGAVRQDPRRPAARRLPIRVAPRFPFPLAVPRVAALLLPTSVLWLDKVPSAEIDMTLVGWVTAALVLFHRALESESRQAHPSRRVGLWCGALLCVAAGTLTKWTAPAFFYLTVIPLLCWRRQLRLLFGWRHLLAVGVAAG